MSIKLKFTWLFVIIALLVAGLSTFVITELETSDENFTYYREIANDSAIADSIQSNLLMSQLDIKDYLRTPNQKEIGEFEEYYKKTDSFVKEALKEISEPSRVLIVKEISQKMLAYHDYFYKIVELYKKRDNIVTNTLNVNDKKIEQLLYAAMISANKDKNLEVSFNIGKSIRALLLIRSYTAKFLASDDIAYANKIHKEFNDLQEDIQILKEEIKNTTRKKQLTQSIELIEIYKFGMKNIITTIRDKDDIINNKLYTTISNITKLAEDVQLSIKKHQDTLGLEIATKNERIQHISITLGIIIILVIILLSVFVVTSALVKPLNLLEELTKDLSEGDGDLTKRLDVKGKDEIAIISHYINLFIEKVQSTIDSVKQTSHENASISHELSTTALSVGNNVENSVDIVEQATSQARDVQNEIVNVIADAQVSKNEIVQANHNLGVARDDIISLTSKVQDTAQTEAELAQSIEELSKEANEVKTVLTIISDIADQTNLLALNAAIEAARAGEHGRGFAVVADEVRKLAERTQKTLSEINATINVVVQSIGDASTQMSNNSNEIQALANIAQGVEDRINSTVTIVNEAVGASDRTVKDFENTGKNVGVIVNKVEEINEFSSTNARNVEEIASAAEHLNTLTNELNTKLETFRT